MPRSRSWADKRLVGETLAVGTPVLEDLLEFLGDSSNELTVVRIIADITVQYLVTTTVNDSLSIVDLGIGVIATSAFGTPTAVPEPSIETEFPPRGWIYVNSVPVSQILDAAGGVSIVDSRAIFKFDIRAMRKIDRGTLFLKISQSNITVGGAMQVTGRVRSLVLT